MARKPKIPPPPPTIDQQKARAKTHFLSWNYVPVELQPPPTRRFEVGEQVLIGNLHDVFIDESIDGGLYYLYHCTWSDRDTPPEVQYRCAWWFDIEKFDSINPTTPRLFSTYVRYPLINTSLNALINYMHSGGIVFDPRYQREYVWDDANKDALIESIFDRLDIGSFLLIRHAGYNHGGDESLVTYRTIDGREVSVPRCDDNTIAVIDGQQRLTTLLDFFLDRRPYKGVYFSQLNRRDRNEFEDTAVAIRLIEEGVVTDKEVVRMFLQSNRGVPQTPEHLAKVQALYDNMGE